MYARNLLELLGFKFNWFDNLLKSIEFRIFLFKK